MPQLRRDMLTALLFVVACAVIMLLMPRSEPERCHGPVQELFWNCVR
jgi:hypothetical protein